MQKKIFKIDEKIYGETYLKLAMDDFKEIAKFNYKKGEIVIEGNIDLDEVFNEFINYVISLYNEQI